MVRTRSENKKKMKVESEGKIVKGEEDKN